MAVRVAAKPLEPAVAFAALPVVVVTGLLTCVESAIAETDARRISREDTLWFQAGSGEAGMSYLDGSNLAPPKWTGAYPSIGEPHGVTGEAERNHFTFQLGR